MLLEEGHRRLEAGDPLSRAFAGPPAGPARADLRRFQPLHDLAVEVVLSRVPLAHRFGGGELGFRHLRRVDTRDTAAADAFSRDVFRLFRAIGRSFLYVAPSMCGACSGHMPSFPRPRSRAGVSSFPFASPVPLGEKARGRGAGRTPSLARTDAFRRPARRLWATRTRAPPCGQSPGHPTTTLTRSDRRLVPPFLPDWARPAYGQPCDSRSYCRRAGLRAPPGARPSEPAAQRAPLLSLVAVRSRHDPSAERMPTMIRADFGEGISGGVMPGGGGGAWCLVPRVATTNCRTALCEVMIETDMKFWWARFRSDSQALRAAAGEVFLVCFLSLVPLFLLPVIDDLRGATNGSLFFAAISGGQLYLYSFSLFGTLFWLSQKEHDHLGRFTPIKWLMLAILVPMFLILGVYTFDPSLTKPLSAELIFSSIIIYLLYVVLYYVLTVFDNMKPPIVAKELKKGSDGLIDRYRTIEPE